MSDRTGVVVGPVEAMVLTGVAVAAVVLLARYMVWHREAAFVIELRDGEPRLVRGTCPRQYLDDVANISRLWGVREGWIEGRATSRGLRIEVRGIDQRHRQAYQNAWDNPLDR